MIYLIVGKIVDGNNVKSYVVMSENGNTQLVKKASILKFCRDNNVLNVTVSKNSLTGKGIMLSNIPKYKDTGMFGMQQMSGMSQAEVIQLAQPYIEKYKQDKINKQTKQNNNNDKTKQEQYVMSKIDIIELLINYALQMKNVTNEMASNGDFTKYIKQIDIDNAEGDSLDNLIKRQGVNGLANGLLDRLNRLKNRVKKFGLDKNLLSMIEHLEKECEQLRKLHSETKQIIRQNKDRESIEEKESKHLESVTEKENLDNIPVVEDAHIDAIEVSAPNEYIENIEDVFGDIPVVEDAADGGILVNVDGDEHQNKDEEHQNKLVNSVLSRVDNIKCSSKTVSEIANKLDMKYPGLHNKLHSNNINNSFASKDELIEDINNHYSKISDNEIYDEVMHNYLGDAGSELSNLIFRGKCIVDLSKFENAMNELTGIIRDKLNNMCETCKEQSLKKFTKLDIKREEMLAELYAKNWEKSANSYYENYYSFGSSSYNQGYEMAKNDTLKEYEGLSDEEFMKKVNAVKQQRLVWKRAKLMEDLEDVDAIYLSRHGISFGEYYKLPNYDRGESRSREKRQIASELLKTKYSDLLALTDAEYEAYIKNLKLTLKQNIIDTVLEMKNNVISMIDALSASDVNNYGQVIDCSNIWNSIDKVDKYIDKVKEHYSIYIEKTVYSKQEITKYYHDKEKEIIKEHSRLASTYRSGLGDVTDLFDFD